MGLKEKTSSEPPATASALCYSGIETVKITRMRVTKDMRLTPGTPLFNYRKLDKDGKIGDREEIYKTQKNGIVVERIIKRINDQVFPGDVLLFYEPCPHSTVFKEICCDCGLDLSQLDTKSQRKIAEDTNVSMVHSIPELRISKQLAEDYGKSDMDDLLERRKLVLLVDLDQTIIHSTNQDVPADRKDIFHYKLYGEKSPWYHTKFRPHMMEFLAEISKYYQLDVCTFGARRYAHQICKLIDPNSKYFPSDRILSRDEFFDPRSKTGNMKSLFPCGDSMVAIIDDRLDVWNYAKNVIHVKPYMCFKTDDINAPEKLSKSFNAAFGKEDAKDVVEVSADKKDEEVLDKKADKKEVKEKVDKKEVEVKAEKKEVEAKAEKKEVEAKAEKKEEEKTDEKEGEEKDEEEKKDEEEDESKEKAEDGEDKDKGDDKEVDKPEEKIELYENSESKKHEHHMLEDNDDYLLHLERMLKMVHAEFFGAYDEKKRYASEGEEVRLPELKEIIPKIRRQTLKGVNIVFSGVIATNHISEQNRFYRLAVSMGAKVSADLVFDPESPLKTTHLVCAKWGSSKVKKVLEANPTAGIKIVSPHWILGCAEKWLKLDEKDFEIVKETNINMVELDDPRKVFFPYYEPRFGRVEVQDKPGTSRQGLEVEDEDQKLLAEMNTSTKFDLLISEDVKAQMLEEVLSDMEDLSDDDDDDEDDDDDDDDFPDDDGKDDDKDEDKDEEVGEDKMNTDSRDSDEIAFPPAMEVEDDEAVYGANDELPCGWKAGRKRSRDEDDDDDDDDDGSGSEYNASDDEVDDWEDIENNPDDY